MREYLTKVEFSWSKSKHMKDTRYFFGRIISHFMGVHLISFLLISLTKIEWYHVKMNPFF